MSHWRGFHSKPCPLAPAMNRAAVAGRAGVFGASGWRTAIGCRSTPPTSGRLQRVALADPARGVARRRSRPALAQVGAVAPTIAPRAATVGQTCGRGQVSDLLSLATQSDSPSVQRKLAPMRLTKLPPARVTHRHAHPQGMQRRRAAIARVGSNGRCRRRRTLASSRPGHSVRAATAVRPHSRARRSG